MRILFLFSGNNPEGISPIIKNQAESLNDQQTSVYYFPVKGQGIKGYLLNINPLRQYVKQKNIDIIHAHYAFTAWIAVLATLKIPIIVSFMGSDLYGDYNIKGRRTLKSYLNIILSQGIQPFIKVAIVKSANLKKYIYVKRKLYVIPNGVDFNKFRPMDMQQAKKELKLDLDKKYVLFLGNPENPRKNISLLKKAMQNLDGHIELLSPFPVKNDKLIFYYNASNVLVLTSFAEGSPNIIKEAMACTCPIISTNVGDVKEVIHKTRGCYIVDNKPEILSKTIKKVLDFKGRTNGRSKILHLDAKIVAQKLLSIYRALMEKSI